jgi:phosphatidylglycerol---prolipoprotein diacylglyceryl transferase
MVDFLHTFTPQRELISIANITIYWYGVFIVLGILAAVVVIFKLADRYQIKKDLVIDALYLLIISGLIGARIYHVLLEYGYYIENPIKIFSVWEGGLAIHGAIFAGLGALWVFAKKKNISFWIMAGIFAPGMALAQSIGRWGNYFNQELYGSPTDLPWGIPIEPANRLMSHYNSQYFHPTFLYESLGSLVIFAILIFLHYRNFKKESKKALFFLIAVTYIMLYSILRFLMEFIRIDEPAIFLGLKWPQIVSLGLILISIFAIKYGKKKFIDFPPRLPGLEKM